jgi:outer membrane protein assembly factor BamA
MYTNTGTWAGAAATKLYFSRDRYRVILGAGTGEFHYDLYGIGQKAGALGLFIPIDQTGSALFFQGVRRLPKNFFLGPRYQIRSLTLKREAGGTLAPAGVRLPEIGIRQQTAALGVAVENDSRNSQFYPTAGGRINFTADFFRESVGSNRNYERYQFEFHRNPSVSPKQVLAYRFYACAVGGRVPVYDLCLYGLDSDIRGYTTGRYRDRRMFAAQAEYRLELPKRFGVVAFGGVGGVAPKVSSFRADALLPAGGAGLRYKLDKKNHINFRFDYAVGLDGGAYYVGVAEAF